MRGSAESRFVVPLDDALAGDIGLDGLDEAVVHTVVLGGRLV